MVIKTYFSRNNTIIANDTTNTGRNPVAELFYGGDVSNLKNSRFLFHFDESRIQSFNTDGTMPDVSKMTHKLKLTNTGAFDTTLLGQTVGGNKTRTASFDLILFKINQAWDEGVGYDFGYQNFIGGSSSTAVSPSNWNYAQTNILWSGGPGVYSGASSAVTITTQHFEFGNENIELDITNEVNDIITGGTTNYGFGLAFPTSFEETPTTDLQYVGFYTRHTQSFYEPFLETTYNETIKDDRNSFFLDKSNKLYLYVNAGGQPTNLDASPSVIIYDNDGLFYTSFTSTEVSHVTKGVYSINLTIPTTTATTDCMMFTDVWSGITINGISRPVKEMEFVLTDSDKYYNVGNNEEFPKQFSFGITGINRDEKIIRGDIRKLIISTRVPYTVNQTVLIDGLEYRIYTKEGRNELTVIDYQNIHKGYNLNYFLLDTLSLLPGTYYIEIKMTSNQEVRQYKDITKFEIVSQSELRNSQ